MFQVFSGSMGMPGVIPEQVTVALQVLHVYAALELDIDNCNGIEEAMIHAAMETLRDYMLGIGRYGPPPPALPPAAPVSQAHVPQSSLTVALDKGQIAQYLAMLQQPHQPRGGQ